MRHGMTIAAFLAAIWGATPGFADKECWVPMTDWQPREAVAKLAEDNGWSLRRIKVDDGCYEIVGTDADGVPIEVKVNPATLEVLAIRYQDDDKEPRSDEGHGDGGGH